MSETGSSVAADGVGSLADALRENDEVEATRHWLDDPPTVAAVLVTHNGASWLPKVLSSYSTMYHAPDLWRAVDVASTDGSAELVRDSFGAERVLHAPKGTGFGAAVAKAVAAMPRTDWIWLLHDDASVLPGTLSGLLDQATSGDDVAVVGPKIREWPSLRRLLEVGLTMSGTGSRETGLEAGEPDAGQHDRPLQVLAVNSAGMLVRRDVWDELGGFDPELPLHGDDLDFGWRVTRAGYRVLSAPGGVIFHAEASRRGVRKRASDDVPAWEKRRGALWTLLANAGPVRFWWQLVRLLVGSMLRCVGLLVSRDPERAGDELRAVRAVYGRPMRLLAARRRRAETARVSPRQVSALMAPFWLPYQHGLDAVRDAILVMIRPELVETTGRRSAAMDAAEPDEVEELDDGPSLLRRRPWLVLVTVLVLLSVVAGRGLLGAWVGHDLAGGALLRAPDTAGGWWSMLLGGQREVGLGAGWPPAFAIPLAAVATPVWFVPSLVITVLMVLAVPLAALSAHRFGRLISEHRGVRMGWAIGYGLLVTAVGAVPQGRIGTVVALVVAPIIANAMWQLAEEPHWRRAVKVGLWVAVGAAFAPVVLVLAWAALAVMWWAEGRWVSRLLPIAALTPLVLLGPWLWVRALHPTRLWWEAGLPVSGSEDLLDVVLGRAGGVSAPGWLSIPLIVLAVVALLPERTRAGARLAWTFALVCLAVALGGHLMSFTPLAGRAHAEVWVGVPSVLWLASLSTAVLAAVPHLIGLLRPLVAAMVVAALVLPVGAAGWWLVHGSADPLQDQPVTSIPAFLAERPGQTLVVRGDIGSGVEFDTVAGAGLSLGQETLVESGEDEDDLAAAVRNLLANATSADVAELSRAGIDAIYLPRADAELARRIDAAPGLEATGSDRPDARAWTLAAEPALADTSVPWWRRGIVGVQVLAWVVALVLVAPARRAVGDSGSVPETDDLASEAITVVPGDANEAVTR